LQPTESPLRQYVQILKRQAWIVVLVPVVTLAATFALLESRDPVYRASTTIVVGTRARGDLPPQLGTSGVTRTMTNLLESDLIARTVIRRHRLDMSVERFLKKLKVEVLPDTSVIQVKYDSTNPRLALSIVSEINRIFTQQVADTLGTESALGSGRPGSSFKIVVRNFDAPHLEPEPIARNPVTSLLFAGLAGLVLGILLAVAREALDSRIRGRRDAEVWFGAPVLGALPKGLNRRPPPGVGVPEGGREDSRSASLDLLRARLQFTQRANDPGGSTILVTSTGLSSGKAAVTANLAASLARAGERVVCVDANLRRPSLHRYLGLPTQAPGLVDVLEATVDLDDALVRIELAPPSVVGENGAKPSEAKGRLEVLRGGSPPSRDDLLTPEAVEALLAQLHKRADYVVFDSPTLLVSDFFPLAVQSDNVLLVARHGRTTRAQAESARETLARIGVENVGVVLTDVTSRDGYE
jgi:Mrp family chromosome partitioning ATPase/capsular polysaccharide biosynthesis protein